MSSKRSPNANKNNNNKKKTKPSKKGPIFTADASSPFERTDNKLTVVIKGLPLSYQRAGANTRYGANHFYDRQKKEKKEFVDTLFSTFVLHDVPPLSFGTDDVEIRATYVFPQKNGKIPNDLDNLNKFLYDCLQLPHKYDDGTLLISFQQYCTRRYGNESLVGMKLVAQITNFVLRAMTGRPSSEEHHHLRYRVLVMYF